MPDVEQVSPPLRVLALTGPLGSGCTTVAEFFDVPGRWRTQPNALLELLLKDKIVASLSPLDVDWPSLNQHVNELGQQIKDNAQLTTLALKANFKRALELRELAHAFPLLFKYYSPNGHLFRTVSVSDLIVFHALRGLEERGFDPLRVPERYRSFAQTIAAANEKITSTFLKKIERQGIFGLRHYYAELHNEQDEHGQEKLVRAFGLIHGLSQRIKTAFGRNHGSEYVSLLQDFGNNLRRCGDPFEDTKAVEPQCCYTLARDVARVIRLLHTCRAGAFFVVDSLRNPFEIVYLRHQFADCFVVSLYADKSIRAERIEAALIERSEESLDATQAKKLFIEADYRDSGSDIKNTDENLYKQNVPKCVQLSDIAINNGKCSFSEECQDALGRSLLRPLSLILQPGCTKPTEDEVFMNEAYTIAVKSNCISRQVGAVVVGPEGYIVGAGWNDVGKGLVSCGLRAIGDLRKPWCEEILEAITRQETSTELLVNELAEIYAKQLPKDVAEQYRFCFKDVMAKKTFLPKALEALKRRIEGLDLEPEKKTVIRESLGRFLGEVLNDVNPHQLEYCLALHAEENAILQGATIGGMGLAGGKMYTTAEPCTLCAKKIHQVGLKEVIYTEPYPKSLPRVYMPDVDARQFEGVKPRAYIRLFMPHHDRKDIQELTALGLIPDM